MIQRLIKICKNCGLCFKNAFELDPKEKNGTLYILMKNISRKVQFETDFDCAETFLYISIGLPWGKATLVREHA